MTIWKIFFPLSYYSIIQIMDPNSIIHNGLFYYPNSFHYRLISLYFYKETITTNKQYISPPEGGRTTEACGG
jgi:hypothetical protein